METEKIEKENTHDLSYHLHHNSIVSVKGVHREAVQIASASEDPNKGCERDT